MNFLDAFACLEIHVDLANDAFSVALTEWFRVYLQMSAFFVSVVLTFAISVHVEKPRFLKKVRCSARIFLHFNIAIPPSNYNE